MAWAMLLAPLVLGSCRGEVKRNTPAASPPLLVVGIDGADPGALRELTAAGDLPNFARVAEEGSFMSLGSALGASPMIWTTIVTGVLPHEHGIEDFYVQTDSGPVPITSGSRRRPALWNMLERVNRRAAILGMWATWPAEPTRGLIISDRIGSSLDREFAPAGRADDAARWLAAARAGGISFGGSSTSNLRDRVVTMAAEESLQDSDFPLVFAYYRSLDISSHKFWHHFEPTAFTASLIRDASIAESPNPVREAYLAVDEALGRLLKAARDDVNLLIVSDHGFRADTSGKPQLLLDLDRVLAEHGSVVYTSSRRVDLEQSTAWTEASPSYFLEKRLTLAPRLSPSERDEVARSLTAYLASCEFGPGAVAFQARPRRDAVGLTEGVDVDVQFENASSSVHCGGREIAGAVLHFAQITGTHDDQTRGILLTRGPIFARGVQSIDLSVFDIAPTILYALGLPAGRDFAGRPGLELFSDAFRRARPARWVASWGLRKAAGATSSDADSELLDELAALGYLN